MELINWTKDYLEEKGFPSPRSDVEWLLSHVLDCSRVQLYADFEKPLTPEELAEFKAVLRQRLDHKPVQYITGETEFMGLPFEVDKSVLIPRPETEILVEHAVSWLRENPVKEPKVLDIGTGSGCIAVSVAALVQTALVWGMDISEAALTIASRNAKLNTVTSRIHFGMQDILNEAPPEAPFDMILSNPPYISEDEADTIQKDVRDYEPVEALFTSHEGLQFFERYASSAREWVQPEGVFMAEIGGTHQSQQILQLFQDHQWQDIQLIKDYNGHDRVLIAKP